MTKRKIITIDNEKCNGCSLCIPNCPEGAIQLIDGKARLVGDLFCDGLGACLGHCPEGAITIEERIAEAYDERKVMDNIIKQGKNTILAHLEHLSEHNETTYLNEALNFLKEKNMDINFKKQNNTNPHNGCPGAKTMVFETEDEQPETISGIKRKSELKQWPIQLHLVSPNAPYYQNKDLVLTADCAGYALGDFHNDYMKGKSIAIACPKLDQNQEIYIDKLTLMIDEAKLNTISVITMEVPCCRGLLAIVKEASGRAKRKIPVKSIIVSLKGEILSEEWQ